MHLFLQICGVVGFGFHAIPFFWKHQSSSAFDFVIMLSIVTVILFFLGWYCFAKAAER